ncbi:uncharacterized protein LOC117110141 isoform X2 [Anneissia japonica]|uniref:uncharacterized protein LOC117110141 isoform X2 n=1 Tax=Anneissia japonica TaxID=1529436 RepID=UPI0014255C2D|nr:uncharacterized protein LOC117110141 isoform X2 [Anneissia japonica]
MIMRAPINKVFTTGKMHVSKKYAGRWGGIRIRRPKTMMKRLSALALVAFFITLYLIFQTGRLQGKGGGRGIHRLNSGIFQQPTRNPFDMKFKGKERMPPTIENLDRAPVSHTADFLLDYFLTMNVDGTQITWLRNTNTRGLLQQALDDYKLMMVEVDVVAENDKSTQNLTAVVAPSDTNVEYNLKLESFLTYISTYSNKGVKLNFDCLDAIKMALKSLKALEFDLHAPIWLAVDVLHGPNADIDKEPVDLQKAVDLVKEYYPPITLSLGWQTDWSPEPVETGYSWYHVISMAKFCVKFQQRASFSIRAVYAAESVRQIKWLLSLSSRFSAVLWLAEHDVVSVSAMVYFRKQTDKKKIFYILPTNFLDELKLTETVAQEDGDSKFDRTLWKPALLDEQSLAFLGKEQAVLEGDNSWLVSKDPHQPGSSGRTNIEVHGNVQFVESPKKSDSIAKFSLFIRCSGVNPPEPKDVHGVKLVILKDGTVTLSSQNLVKAGMYKTQTSAKLPESSCFAFKVIDSGEAQPILCTISIINCKNREEVSSDKSEVSLHLIAPYDDSRQMFFIAVTGGSTAEAIVVENLIIS